MIRTCVIMLRVWSLLKGTTRCLFINKGTLNDVRLATLRKLRVTRCVRLTVGGHADEHGTSIGLCHDIVNLLSKVWRSDSKRKIEWTFTCTFLNNPTITKHWDKSSIITVGIKLKRKHDGLTSLSSDCTLRIVVSRLAKLASKKRPELWRDKHRSVTTFVNSSVLCQKTRRLSFPSLPTAQTWLHAIFSYSRNWSRYWKDAVLASLKQIL